MTLRNALLAACAGALVLTATLARAGEPIPGVDVNIPCNPRTGYGCSKAFKGAAPAQGSQQQRAARQPGASGSTNQRTFVDGDASIGIRRGKLTDNDNPRPTDRLSISPGSGGGPQRR